MTRTTREACLLLVMFGQFVAHDIIDTPVTSIDGRNFQCCGLPRIHQHSQCATIEIPTWDPFYSRFNETCMQFVRSVPCDTCSQGKRQHINQVTSFVDASVVYGSWEDMTRTVREHQRGRLKTEFSDLGGSLLPQNKSEASCPVQNGEFPFLAGDRRVNQHLILMSLHTLFMREHNRVVGIIEKKYPYYDDLTLFQEARKVVIGELQSIVYNEFLPVLLGEELMTKYGLRAIYDGTSHYDPLVNPTIFTEFSTAGFRLHSLVNRFGGDRPIDGNVWSFKDTYGNVGPLYHGALEGLILTVTGRPGSINGPMVVEDLTEFMYKPSCMEKGLDIVSGNVQRGRDHGLPPYYQVLQNFTGKTITDFNDLQEFIQPEALEQIMEIYSDVKDVDLWIGLLGEFTDSNTFLGLTCRTLIAEQFRRLRYGDRWFFTEPGQFSEEQQKALSNASFGRILCDNLDITMAPNSFYLGDFEYCSNIPSVSI